MTNEIVSKIGKVEQLELFPAEQFVNVLDETLAEWINTGHQAIQMAVVKLTIHAAQVGAWLTVMKSRKEHGGWEDWVAENCLFDIRTAQRYMKLYRKLMALPKTTLVSFLNLPVNTAYRELSVVKTPTELAPVETPPLPEGKYDVIVIDPPWPMQKIERGEAPEQESFDYTPMSIDELKMLDIPCADNCHVWLWTTQKYLPIAFDVLKEWQLSYICTFVWHKNGGFQPFNLPQYNCEFALYARKGSPQFADLKDFNTCFSAPRGNHSEKPEIFYEMIRRVTSGKRLDMFNRRIIEAFDTWGVEAK